MTLAQPEDVLENPTMRIICTHEKGWHVRIEWSDGYIDHYAPRNGPGWEILDIRDCQAFIDKQREEHDG